MTRPYAEYVEWDTARRARFPSAKHYIYKSRLDDFVVAEWSPETGGTIS